MALAGVGVVAVPGGAAAAQACQAPVEPAETIPEVPWAQAWFAPERVWPLSRGDGVLVAVVDSGVDISHPQLGAGQVRSGRDLVAGGGTDGRVDCDAHGTAVASVVAAAPVDGVGFAGLAPDAEILPVRVAETNAEATDPDQEPPVTPAAFAEAVTWAADQGAQVINVSVVFYHDHEVVDDAVRHAQDRDAVVVAAVGNLHVEDGPDPTPYPAAYPGVVGVGAIGVTGSRLAESYVGPHVDLVAPGDGVTVAAAGAGHLLVSGTSFAAPFVSATAALVRAADPGLTADEVVQRLAATADPAGSAQQYGDGVANPYRALTERFAGGDPAAAEPLPEVAVDPVAEARAEQWRRTVARAVLVAGGAVLLSLLALLGAALWRRGRRHRWAPGLVADPAPPETGPDEPERIFYTVPTPRR